VPPEVATFATVLSPAPLVDLFRQLALAQTAVDTAVESLDRAEKLFATGELVARKDVQAAKAQTQQDRAMLQALEDRLQLEWGAHFAEIKSSERASLLADLLAGRQSLLRISAPRDEPRRPLAARFKGFRCTQLFPAPLVDPASQTPSFLGLVAAPLAVGLSLSGQLELPGEARTGLFVPEAGVVFYLGKAWAYQAMTKNQFSRLEIPTDQSVEGGWLIKGQPMFLVTQGAQALLSQETLAPVTKETD